MLMRSPSEELIELPFDKLRELSWMSRASTATGGNTDFVSERSVDDLDDDVPTVESAFLDVSKLEEVVAFIADAFPDVSELEAAVDYNLLRQSCSTTDEKFECSNDAPTCPSIPGETSDRSDGVCTSNAKLIIKSLSMAEFQLERCSVQCTSIQSARSSPSRHQSALFEVAQFKLRTCQQELSQLRSCESRMSEDVLKVSSRLVDLSMDLFQYACQRDMPGSMELFEETVETIDEAASIMRGCSHDIPMIADMPKEQSFPNPTQME
jgi:hypothetical protein